MNCEDKIEFVDWDKRFSDEDKDTIKEMLINMVRNNDRLRFVCIDRVVYEIRQFLTTCDYCSPNEWGETHYILVEVIDDSTEICVFRHYQCGVRWMYDVGAMEEFLKEL